MTIHDLVVVNVNNKPGFYARIEDITPDVKPGWWQVRLLVLTFPIQIFNWILDEYQLEGAAFTMGGTPIQLIPVGSPADDLQETPEAQEQQEPEPKKKPRAGGGAKVVSLLDRLKK